MINAQTFPQKLLYIITDTDKIQHTIQTRHKQDYRQDIDIVHKKTPRSTIERGVFSILKLWISRRSPEPTRTKPGYSTVTDLAKLRGWSTSHPLTTAI